MTAQGVGERRAEDAGADDDDFGLVVLVAVDVRFLVVEPGQVGLEGFGVLVHDARFRRSRGDVVVFLSHELEEDDVGGKKRGVCGRHERSQPTHSACRFALPKFSNDSGLLRLSFRVQICQDRAWRGVGPLVSHTGGIGFRNRHARKK